MKDESVNFNRTDPNTGQPYPKDVAVDNWLNTNNIETVPTSYTNIQGSSNGERSIIEAIKSDPALYDSTTGKPISGSFVIASNDKSFFKASNPEAVDFVGSVGNTQKVTASLTAVGAITNADYADLRDNGSSTLRNWPSDAQIVDLQNNAEFNSITNTVNKLGKAFDVLGVGIVTGAVGNLLLSADSAYASGDAVLGDQYRAEAVNEMSEFLVDFTEGAIGGAIGLAAMISSMPRQAHLTYNPQMY